MSTDVYLSTGKGVDNQIFLQQFSLKGLVCERILHQVDTTGHIEFGRRVQHHRANLTKKCRSTSFCVCIHVLCMYAFVESISEVTVCMSALENKNLQSCLHFILVIMY